MEMYSLDETTVDKLFYSPLHLPQVKPEAGTPGSGQGDAVALDGTGSVPLTGKSWHRVQAVLQTTAQLSGGGSSGAISEISVTSQDGASECSRRDRFRPGLCPGREI